MLAIVHQLQVIEKDISQWSCGLNYREGGKAGGVHGGMNALFPAGPKQGQEKFCLQQGLAAGKGHAAAGFVVKDNVLLNFRHCFRDSELPAQQLPGAGAAHFGAFSAQPARVWGAGSGAADKTGAALDTAVPADYEFFSGGLSLGIMAPEARKGAALEKYSGANSRAIADGVLHNIKD